MTGKRKSTRLTKREVAVAIRALATYTAGAWGEGDAGDEDDQTFDEAQSAIEKLCLRITEKESEP